MHDPSESASNLEIVRCLYDAFESGDFVSPARYFSPEVEGYSSDFLPWGGHVQGLEAMAESVRSWRSRFADNFEPDEIFVAGREVVAIGHTVGFDKGTCESYCIRGVQIWRFEGGRVVSLSTFAHSDSLFGRIA